MSSRNILVTGGAGYIGSHTCKYLADQGYTPICIDDLSQGHQWAVKWGPLEKASVLDKAALEGIFQKHQPQAVIHFAALSIVSESNKNPISYYRTNVGGTLTLLEAMLKHNVKQFVFSSTAAVYGEPQSLPIKEDHPLTPVNVYGRTKLAVEKMLEDFSAAYGLNYAALRYFNAAGADADAGIGEVHSPETHLIPLALNACLDPKTELKVFGTDYATPDGTAIRDYIHVNDLAKAHVAALEALDKRPMNLSLNLGTGHGYSVYQILDEAEKVTGKKIKRLIMPRRTGDPAILVAANGRAKEILGISFENSNLQNIVASAWKFHSGLHNQNV